MFIALPTLLRLAFSTAALHRLIPSVSVIDSFHTYKNPVLLASKDLKKSVSQPNRPAEQQTILHAAQKWHTVRL
jgi:hypothetical protein